MASGRIKGITIEIDGSTTGLTKALKETESNLSSVQRSLKDVNKLLKVDPTNTELLSQKQKLLSEAVDETKKKLDALKSASEQAAKTAGNYDAWKKVYTPIQEEITKTQEKVKGLKEKMAELEKAGKVDTSEYKELEKELQNAEDHLKDLKQQAKATSDEFGNPISHEQYDALQREIIETEQNLKNLKEQAKDTASVLGTQMQEAGKKISDAGNKVTDVGGKLTKYVTAPIAAVGVAAGKMSMDFDDAIAKVSTIADETEVPIEDLRSAIIDLSDQTGISSSEIADNVYNAISAGQKTGDAVNFVSNATKLARAGFAESGDALDILTTIMNAYGMEAEDVTRVSDVLIQTQNLGKTTVAELSSAMGKVIPTAKSQGVQLEELAGAYAVMTSNGIATAETTTYLNSMLNELGKQGTSASEAFRKGTEHIKEGGLSMAEAMEQGWSLTDVLSILDEQAVESGTSIENMFSSSEAGKAANVLWDNASKVNDAVEQMGNSAGATEEAFGKLDTKSYEMDQTINQFKNTMIELGDAVMEAVWPIIQDLSDKVREFSEWFRGLDEDTQTMIVTIAAVIAAIGPLLVIIGPLITSVGAITGAIGTLMSMGLLPVIGVIAGVVAAGVLLYQNWDTIKEKAAELRDKVVEKIEELKNGAIEKYESLKKEALEKFESMKNDISTKVSNIKKDVTDKFKSMKDDAIGKINELKSNVSEKFDAIKSKITEKIDGAKDKVKEAIDKIKGFFDFSWSLPDLKMPHPYISGKFSLNPPSVPSFGIDWYKKGYKQIMSLSSPTIFGYSGKTNELLGGGEGNGNELVGGEDRFVGLIGQVMDSKIGRVGDKLDTLISVTKSGMKEVADRSEKNVVLSDGALVGKLTPKINTRLGQTQRLEDRYAW